MASSAIFLTIILSAVVASTSGYTIGNPQAIKTDRLVTSTSSTVSRPVSVGNKFDYRNQPIAGYPKVPPPNAFESGGSDDDLLPPFEDAPTSPSFRRSVQDVKVDPKTGYPLDAEPSWKYAGGDERSLELPVEGEDANEREALDPKTGYPLLAQPQWKDAGGNGDIIALPLEDGEENFGQKEEVDPKTGYPLKANPAWKDAGGNGDTLELPLEDVLKRSDEEVDPKTGYPLVAQESWKDAGGDGDILELPLEGPSQETSEAVDPKTGYPLAANPAWKDAGGDGDILELPLEDGAAAVDPKTGYPLTAQPSWKAAGGDGDILELPLEENSVPVDPKTGYPLIAQPSWKDAGGDGDILQLPLDSSEKPAGEAVDPKTGYPLVAQPEWRDAGGNEDILELPLETPSKDVGGELEGRIAGPEQQEFDIRKLTELQPPPLEKNFPTVISNSFSTPSPIARKSSTSASSSPNQKRNSFPSPTRFDFFGGTSENRLVESSYTYTGPENAIVTVTRFLSKPIGVEEAQSFPKSSNFQNTNGVPAHLGHSISFQQRQQRNSNAVKKIA